MMEKYPNNMNNWCPVFTPTIEEFQSFKKYITDIIEPKCKNIGICKIIPPNDWFTYSYEDLNYKIPQPISQHIGGKKGIYNVDLVEKKSMQLKDFKKYSEKLSSDEPNDNLNPECIEKAFWRGIRPTMTPPIYGADILGTLFPENEGGSWNLNNLDTILRKHVNLPGITKPMLYFGMWKSCFAFHVEDVNLYSINYIHTGKAKFWYGVPPQYAKKFEEAARSMYPEKDIMCSEFLRHKTSLFSPSRLKEFSIPYYKVLQNSGEFVITFPGSYHEGFNTGYNIAEAVNFATLRWIPKGLEAKICKCESYSIRIDMDVFLSNLLHSYRDNYDKIIHLNENAKRNISSEMIQVSNYFNYEKLNNNISEPQENMISIELEKTKNITFSNIKKIEENEFWLFSCICSTFGYGIGHKAEEGQVMDVNDPWFSCIRCHVWVHIRCISANIQRIQNVQNPDIKYCHRCNKIVNGIMYKNKPNRRKRCKTGTS